MIVLIVFNDLLANVPNNQLPERSNKLNCKKFADAKNSPLAVSVDYVFIQFYFILFLIYANKN